MSNPHDKLFLCTFRIDSTSGSTIIKGERDYRLVKAVNADEAEEKLYDYLGDDQYRLGYCHVHGVIE